MRYRLTRAAASATTRSTTGGRRLTHQGASQLPINEMSTVRQVLRTLSDAGLECWLFGGWAEELQGVSEPRPHRDIDVLYVANDFERLDELIRASQMAEVHGKRFHHKRAFLFEGVMVEAFLVETDNSGRFTLFWGHARHSWPADTFSRLAKMPVASKAALEKYKREHARFADARFAVS